MTKSDRPKFSLEVECQIEAATNQVHEHYWQRLAEMQVIRPHVDEFQRKAFPLLSSIPPIPKSPSKLLWILSSYATDLFDREADFYPYDPELKHWLTNLATRVGTKVIHVVADLEEKSRQREVSLAHHGVRQQEMEKAIADALKDRVRHRLIAGGKDQILADVHKATQEFLNQREGRNEQKSRNDVARERKRFIEPILAEKGWSPLQWALEAEVAYNTVADYLSAKKKPYPSTRVKLAKALGVHPNSLPK